MRVLVTGIGGFAGLWLARALLDAGPGVHGLVRGEGPWPRLAELPIALHRGELPDVGVWEVIRGLVPDAVVHLAALSFVPACERDPAGAYRTNVGGTLAILAAVRAHAARARVLVVTSADVYGAVEAAELPLAEEAPFRPLTVYGASKAAMDVAAAQWARAYGLDVIRARPFNHTGPGQDASFVCTALAPVRRPPGRGGSGRRTQASTPPRGGGRRAPARRRVCARDRGARRKYRVGARAQRSARGGRPHPTTRPRTPDFGLPLNGGTG